MLETMATMGGWTVAQAASRLDDQEDAREALQQLEKSAADVDGAYFVRTDSKMRVNVSTAATAARARALGLIPQTVARGETELEDLAQQVAVLSQTAQVADLKSAAIDLPSQSVLITLGTSPKAVQFGRQISKVPGVKVRHDPGTKALLTTHIGGNGMRVSPDGVSNPSGCTQGFSGLRAGSLVMLTVGHCYTGVGKWVYTGTPSTSTYLGQVIGNAFTFGRPASAPAPDIALVQLTPSAGAYSSINTHVPSEGYRAMAAVQAPRAYQEMPVCKSGTRTGWSCGWVGHREPYVNIGNGYLGPTWTADFCAKEGDSGGPVVSGNFAVGLVSAGNKNQACALNAGWANRDTDQTTFSEVGLVLSGYPGTTTNF